MQRKRVLAFIFGLVLLVSAVYASPWINKNLEKKSAPQNRKEKTQIRTPNSSVILLVGVDQRKGDVGRTDTILLAFVNPEKRKIFSLSIPRDSRVEIPGRQGFDKINAAYVYGGMPLTQKTIEYLLGINIDYYVKMNFEGFAQIIDTLGGVKLNVTERMKYTDRSGNLYIDIEPGYQTLNGQKAIQYVRFRHDVTGSDTARISRQQKLVQALIAQNLKASTILKIPQILRETGRNVETNISPLKTIQYADFSRKIGRQGIESPITLPGTPQYIGGISYFLPDYTKSQQIVKDLLQGKLPSQNS